MVTDLILGCSVKCSGPAACDIVPIHNLTGLQILMTSSAESMLREVQIVMPLLRRLVAVKLYDEEAYIILAVLDKLKQ